MGIRGIDAYLRESKLLQTAPLSALNGSRLGIDAKHYLTNLLTSPDSQEPLLAATGGVHLSITQRVENDLRTLDRNQIKPVFIFPGLPTQGRPPHKGFDPAADRETRTKEEAWECYENGDVTKAVQTLSAGAGKNANGSTGWTDYRDVVRLVLRVFKHRVVEYIFAPYLEQAQLAYLLNHPKGYIHAIYTSTESLLWQVDKVITHIDFPTSFTFVDKSQLLPALRLSPDQFLDMGILAGCSLCRTFPPTARDFTLGAIIDIVKNYKSGLAAVQQYRGAPADAGKMANYPEAFMRARLAIRFSFIYTTEGICMPYALAIPNSQVTSASDVPADIDEIFSPRLPDELYFYMCKGVISPQVIGWLTTGMIVESQPLSDSYDYQRFAKELLTETSTSPRILALALLADSLHPQWKQRRVGAHYWHDPAHFPPMGAPVNFNHKDTQGLVAACSSWKVPYAVLEQELRRQSMSTIDIKLCIGALADEQTADKTTHPSSKPLERKDEFVANVIWRFLYLRGFIVGHDHRQALIGQALHTALLQSKVNDRFQEPMFIVLELMRAGVLHGQKFGNEYRSGGPVSGSEEDQASSMLIMRCLSVLPLNFRPHQWAGPLSRELLVFNSFPRGVSKSLRHLLEAISANMLLTGAVRKNRDEYMDLILSLPFQTETNTGFGILFKTYLDVTLFSFEGENGSGITESNMDSQAAKDAKAQALEFVEQSFESVKNPRLEVERGFRFWDTVMTAIKHIESVQSADPARSVLVQPAVLAEYKRADQWLKPLRP